MASTEIGIDLGTDSILVSVMGKGVVLKEPTVAAIDRDSNTIQAIGEEARRMLGRTPENIVAVRPIKKGEISDYAIAEKMVEYFIRKAVGKRGMSKPTISLSVPSTATEEARRNLSDAAFQAGARDVKLIDGPVAAAIGAGIDILKPCGNMIVDVGAGKTDIAVISLGGIVVSTTVKIGGDDFDEAIMRCLRKKHSLLIGDEAAEDIKIKLGTCYPSPEPTSLEVRGRNLLNGLPKAAIVSSEEIRETLENMAFHIVDAIHSVLQNTPLELAADVAERGIVLTGGGAMLHGLEELIESRIEVNTMTAEDPMGCAACGLEKYAEMFSKKKKGIR